MTLSRSLRQCVAMVLSLALMRPDLAVAAAAPSRGARLVPAAAVMAPVIGVTPLGASLSAPAAPIGAAVTRHPIIGMLDDLRGKGIALPDTFASAADAAQLVAVAQALPEGFMRGRLLMMAKAAAGTQGPGASDHSAELGAAFDNSNVSQASPVNGWTRLSQRSWVPNGLAKRFAARGERLSPKAAPVDPKTLEVPLAKLRWTPSAETLPASTRDIVVGDKKVVGQDRALKSIYWGLRIPGRSYNLYVSGPNGSGRKTAVRQVVEPLALTLPTPPDIVAVTNFEDEQQPLLLELPAGGGVGLEAAVGKFVAAYQEHLPQALSSKSVVAMKRQVKAEYEAGVAQRLAVFNEQVAQVRLSNDKFGISVFARESEGGVEPSVIVTYKDPESGQFKTVSSDEEFESLVAAGVFTQEEWQQAVEEGKSVGAPFRDQLEDLLLEDSKEGEKANRAIYELNGRVAAEVVERLSPIVAGAVSRNRHDTPEHRAFEARMDQRKKAFGDAVAKLRIGEYGVSLSVHDGQITIGVMKVIDGKMVRMSKEEYEAKIAAGELSEAQIKKALAPLLAQLKLMAKKNNDEHEEVHAKDLPASPEELKALAYVQALAKHAAAHFPVFLPQDDSDESPQAIIRRARMDPDEMYRVNVLTDNGGKIGGPVIFEESPSYERLFTPAEDNSKKVLMPTGSVVRTQGPGGPTLKAGAFLRANGGFLILKVMDVLREPGAWPALMQAVRNGQAEIAEEGGEKHYVPAKVKVVLIGSPVIKMLLAENDESFASAFNAAAEFEPSLPIGAETISGYLQFLKKVITMSGGELLDMTRGGIAALLEFSAREAGGNTVLSARFGMLHSLMREASFWARESASGEVRREDIDAALQARAEPEDVFTRRLLESYASGRVKVETAGSKIGQINGLAVMGSLGVPMRMTVVTAAGQPGLISVDRNADASGSNFNKALGVVEGYLDHLFGQKKPVSAKISIAFEQLYGGIDGDSATSTEIYGILSSLSGVPIQQRFAVTGSADQFGNVQPIGGANEKTEGFFAVAASQIVNKAHEDGLNAVIMPADNESELMLSPEVVQAVREGRFKIYKVRTIREGMELLTGVPWDTILQKAQARLDELRVAAY